MIEPGYWWVKFDYGYEIVKVTRTISDLIKGIETDDRWVFVHDQEGSIEFEDFRHWNFVKRIEDFNE